LVLAFNLVARAQEGHPAVPEATYSSSRFGISFRIPTNYTLLQGQGVGARTGDFGFVPGDAGEYLFAKLDRSSGFPQFPILAPSAAALYFGIHLGVTEQTCLAPLDFPGYRSKGTLVLDQITFHWSADPGPAKLQMLVRSPFAEEYFRDYAGFANGVCYEFHLRSRMNQRDNTVSELEAAVSSIRIFPRAVPAQANPGLPETPFPLPEEILGLLRLAPWQISYPKSFGFPRPLRPPSTSQSENPPAQLFPSGPDLSQFNAISLSYVSQLQDGDEATAATTKLAQEIVAYLEQHQWSTVHPAAGPASRFGSGTYRKEGARLDFSVGTNLCTMNSPCTQFDTLTITVYLPVHDSFAP